MNRNAYSEQQAHASFQPRSPQRAIESTQLGQPVHHSSSSSDLSSKWLNKASSWVADKFQIVQTFMNGSGDAILQKRGYANAPDRILPALKATVKPELSQVDRANQPLVGVIDAGFGTDEHGSKMVAAIQKENPQAKIWQGGGVGTGGALASLTEFVNVAKATGQRAVANLSFDLTEVHPDGSSSTRTQLTAEEQSALAYARDSGVLVVASSGNQGGAMSALGQASQASDNLIVVGAANESDRASYSSYGNGLDLVADVGAAGTSSAAATVTGTIANIWSANPELSGQQVNQILTATAIDLKTSGWDAETGAGLLNSTGAIELARSTTPALTVFSGDRLMQRVSGSLGSATWESRDGAVARERTTGFGTWLKDNAHGILDVAGFIPVVGAVADVANAGLYAAEGDYANAALSAAAAVPGVGDAAAAVKLANRGVQAVQAANRGTRTTRSATARAIPSRRSPDRSPVPAARPTASGRRRPAPDRPGSSGTLRRPSSVRRERQPVAVSSGRPSVKPQERKPVVGTGSRPATRRQADHQPGLGTARRPRSQRPESNPGSSPSRSTQPTGQITIRRGDTLWEIAERNLGSGTRWRELRKPDGSSFTERDARRLQPGESVRLPDPQPRQTPTQSPWSPPPRKTPDLTPYIHTTDDRKYALDPVVLSRLDEIRQGESLSEFAKRIRTRMRDNNKSPAGGGKGSSGGLLPDRLFSPDQSRGNEILTSPYCSLERDPASINRSDDTTTQRTQGLIPDAQGRLRDPQGRFGKDPSKPKDDLDRKARAHASKTRRESFRREALNTINRARGSHPLQFLVDEHGKWRTSDSQSEELGIQAGHLTSNHSLATGNYHNEAPERFALEDALFNWMDSKAEGGGAIHEKSAIEIGGLPVEKETAEMWEKIGLIPKGTVANARPHSGWTRP
ncbi:S8 family serine peptidase [Altericista sp. CCNU0014]|uniref:S8 family serine peptidase n=1 Tax=Altericista sp. CCNU0014 TaxID=3082949 RepID=UPI003850F6C6